MDETHEFASNTKAYNSAMTWQWFIWLRPAWLRPYAYRSTVASGRTPG